MKLQLLGYTVALAGVLSFSSCDDSALSKYVDQEVMLKPNGSAALVGQVDFTHTYYYTAYEQQCESHVVCSDTVRAMIMPGDHGNHGDHGGHSGGGGFTPPSQGGNHGGGDNDDHHGGDSDDHHGGDNDDHHGGDNDDHPVPPQPVCWTEQFNCHEVPYTASADETIPSPVAVTLKGAASDAIGTLKLGVETNSDFVAAVQNPSLRPDGLSALFDAFSVKDKTLLILESDKYELVPGQDFIQVPADFQAGQTLTVSVQVQAASAQTAKMKISSVGSEQSLPPLNF